MLYYLTSGALLLLLIVIWQRTKHAKRQRYTTALRLRMEEVEQAERAFRRHLAPDAGYFSHYTLRTWQGQYEALRQAVEAGQYLKTDLSATEKGVLGAFVSYYTDGEAVRAGFNQGFVERELARYDALFNQVEGRSLDTQQRTAIVRDEDNNLVVAGAGSGKTTTIVGKVQYVLDRYRVAPERILLISFTNKSAATLAERIGIAGIEPRTFHKFGKDVIATVEGRQPSLYDENQLNAFLAGALQDLLRQPAYAQLVIDFFLRQLKPQKPSEAFRNRGEYIQFLRDFGMQPYRATKQEANGRVTYQREAVKSVEECHIANFLYLNNVEYHYEAPYEYTTATAQYAQWKPDFTIVQDGKRFYLEHFGVDKNGNVPAFFAKEGQSVLEARTRYWEKIEWARQTSRKHGTVLLETYSYQHAEQRLTEALRTQLEEHGIRLRPKTAAEVWEILSTVAEDEVGSFQTLLRTFLLHLKSSNCTIEEARMRNERVPAVHERERNRHFLAIIEPLVERYAQELVRREEIDFNDLINRAAGYVSTRQYSHTYDYIIIDEFQDISRGRAQLIRALTERHPETKLFCVGDDWQSIYRFAGSDLSLFTHFGKEFGHSLHSYIETTYRFHEPLLSQSSTFITRNPSQTPKQLRSGLPGRRTQLRVVATPAGQQDDTATLVELLEDLIASVPDLARKELLLLGRYSFDFRRIRNTTRVFRIDATRATLYYDYVDAAGRPQTLQLPFLTVHKSKGLEADIVVVLNCNAGRRGFPSEMADDPVLGLVLSAADQFPNGEERRLFYVALTRAKEQVILLTDPTAKSKFVLELEGQTGSVAGRLAGRQCPVCQTTELVLKSGVSAQGKPWSFYGCPNFTYGCDYREWAKSTARQMQVSQ